MMNLLSLLAQQTNLNLDSFRFQSGSSTPVNQLFLVGGLGFLVLVGVVLGLVYFRNRKRLAEGRRQREEARLRFVLAEHEIGEKERLVLAQVCESDHPKDILPLLDSRPIFEKRVREFRERYPNHAVLKRVAPLRQQLSYGFSNARNPFSDTRMLAPGAKLQARIMAGKRAISYVTTVVALNEHQLFVRPPTTKQKSVTLPKLKRITFRVTRDGDAEYEFSCAMLGQLKTEHKPVVVAHSNQVQKLTFRANKRYSVSLENSFYVVKKEFVSERSTKAFRTQDSQYMFNGVLRNLSVGGAMMQVTDSPQQPVVGDMLVFKLQMAQVKDNLHAMVVSIVKKGEQGLQLHIQYVGMKEIHRLKLNKYLMGLDKQQPAPPAGASAAGAQSAVAR